MTPNQLKVLDYVRERIEITGVGPSYDEIREALGHKSKSSTSRIVDALVREGKLFRKEGRHRGLSLTSHSLAEVPTADLRAELARRNHGEPK
jgi:repressor LexA